MKSFSFIFVAALLLAPLAGGATEVQSGAPGKPLATLAAAAQRYRAGLPAPVRESLSARLAGLNADITARGFIFPKDANTRLLTGYAYQEFYDWDLYFENLYLSYYGISDYCLINLKEFLRRQKPDGFIPRSFGVCNYGRFQPFKPFLAQIAVLGSRQRGNDFRWLLPDSYDALRKYLDRWLAYDTDHNGLPVWESSDASGMDNQVRRTGRRGKTGQSYYGEGVDLACELHREYKAMAVIAGQLGKEDDRKEWLDRADKLAALIDRTFWDEKEGFYYDRDQRTGLPIKVKSVAGFFPLWAGVASAEHAKRLIKEHLLNTNEFWLAYPLASFAATEPDYYQGSKHGECNWQGPSWVPVNYMVMHGLIRYGYRDAARELARRSFEMALDKNAVTREYYNAETGIGYGMNPFWGWSSLAYVMPLEEAIGYDPMDPESGIHPILKEIGVKAPVLPAAASGQR